MKSSATRSHQPRSL